MRLSVGTGGERQASEELVDTGEVKAWSWGERCRCEPRRQSPACEENAQQESSQGSPGRGQGPLTLTEERGWRLPGSDTRSTEGLFEARLAFPLC